MPEIRPLPITVSPLRRGPEDVVKMSFPLRYGTYTEVKTTDFEFIFNLNGEIRFIRGLRPNWPHPAEQLKRTDGNDWVYYTVGDESGTMGVRSWMGEYYLPCLSYPSNPVWLVDYFSKPAVMTGFAAWQQLYADLATTNGCTSGERKTIERIVANDDTALRARTLRLHDIIGGRVSVLPPDTRHVDYEVIPVTIADGCLYRCDFCCVKSADRFRTRDRETVTEQVLRLRDFHGDNIVNYKAVFLGGHDGLAADDETILFAARHAYDTFGFESRTTRPSLFLFASIRSLLKRGQGFFERLNALPYRTFVNIGLESAHQPTLKALGKPESEARVRETFHVLLGLNREFPHIEATANFVLGENLPPEHFDSVADLLGNAPRPENGKGAAYLSPLQDSPHKRELLPLVRDMQGRSNLPVHLYLIQRL